MVVTAPTWSPQTGRLRRSSADQSQPSFDHMSDGFDMSESHRPEAEMDSGEQYALRVLVVDDNAIIRQTLALLLEDQPDIQVIGEASDGRQAVKLARTLRPDVVLMDLKMPVMDGVEATRRITEEHPDVRVIGLSMYDGSDGARAMREAGATDYLVKSDAPESIVAAIRNEPV
jgi:CheY-like chemotaxis protein